MARPKKSKAAEVNAVEEVKVVEEAVTEVAAEEAETPAVEENVVAEEEVKKTKKAAKKTTKKVTEETAEAETKKAPAKRAKKETVITLEFGDYTANMSVVEERVRAQFVADGHKATEIKVLNIYVKPFENSAYYVINETETGRVDLF